MNCVIGGKTVEIKPGMTDSATHRNEALRAAEEILKKDARCTGKQVKIEWRENRGITVDTVFAFDQAKGREVRKFVAPFDDLTVP